MHDPMTVAFEIKYPWRKYGKKGKNEFERTYRESFITIWHVDPELHGSDDSCGWSYPSLRDQKWVDSLQKEFVHQFEENPEKLALQVADEGWPTWFVLWLHRASFLHRNRPLSQRCIAAFMYQESYPGNRDFTPELQDVGRNAFIVARIYSRLIRPWYRHPRWHVWHWKLQVHPLQTFKRWAFTRCAGCGKGMTWGYSPVTTSWHGTGPRWFRSETHTYHDQCCPSSSPQSGAVHAGVAESE